MGSDSWTCPTSQIYRGVQPAWVDGNCGTWRGGEKFHWSWLMVKLWKSSAGGGVAPRFSHASTLDSTYYDSRGNSHLPKGTLPRFPPSPLHKCTLLSGNLKRQPPHLQLPSQGHLSSKSRSLYAQQVFGGEGRSNKIHVHSSMCKITCECCFSLFVTVAHAVNKVIYFYKII